MNKHNERAELPQRGTADEQAKDLWELYLKAAKISGSSLLANEPCPESDKAALYRIACDVLNGIGCVYYDITGEWPNLNAPHKAAALLEAQPARELVGLDEEKAEALIEDLAEWSRYVDEDHAHQTLEKHVRDVLEKHGIKEKQ